MELGTCSLVHSFQGHVSLVWWRHSLPASLTTVGEINKKVQSTRTCGCFKNQGWEQRNMPTFDDVSEQNAKN